MIGYPSGQDGAILPARDYPLYPARKIPRNPCNNSFVDQVGSVTMAGYWPRFFCEFMSVSTHKHAKKNLANIQPSWAHTWSITHMSLIMITFHLVINSPECKRDPSVQLDFSLARCLSKFETLSWCLNLSPHDISSARVSQVLVAVYPLLKQSVFCRLSTRNYTPCMSWMMCCQGNHGPSPDVIIFAFLCFILDQTDDAVPVYSALFF